MALQNLKAEMRRKGITQAQVARSLGMSENNFCLKCNERIPMTIDEAKAIRDGFMPEFKLDYLFASDGDLPTTRERADAAVESFIERTFADEEEPARSIEADELRTKSRRTDPEHVIRVIG